jgi:hypothetical protein
MAKFDNNNSGVLYKNDKEGHANRADYRGNAEVNSIEYWLDAWINETRDGMKYMRLRFKPKQQPLGEQQQPKPQQPDFDDKIPF